jgi:hypothetical protein
MSARWDSLIAALLACVLSAPGCLRFAYDALGKPRETDAGVDAGGGNGGPPAAHGGRGGAGSPGAAGRGGAGSGGDGGGEGGGSDGGAEPRDAEIDGDSVSEDAAIQDGSTADAGAADGGKTGVLCPDIPGLLFCDGFENVRLEDSWDYSTVQNGSATRVTDFKRTGAASLHATTGAPMQDTWSRCGTQVLNKLKSGHAWMRSYNWLPASAKIMPYFSLGALSENVQPYEGFELRLRPAHVEISATGGVWGSMMVPFPRERWVCVELHAFIDPAAGFYEVYFDGTLVVASALHDTQPADGLTAAEVGVHYAAPMQPATEVYVDDVAVGTARIPCQ